jgi:uncharacterized protein YciI
MRKTIALFFFFMPFLLIGQPKAEKNNTPQVKQFWFVLLKAGPKRNQDSLTASKIQVGHMENIKRLYEEGKLKVAGPFADNRLAQGIFIFDCATEKELNDLLTTDPAIKAGRLIFEIYPWYTAPIGSFAPGKPLKN